MTVRPLPVLALGSVPAACPVMVGLFVTTEGWLNAKAQPAERGRVFAIYMVGTFVALGLGQILIGQIDINGPTSFNIIISLFAMAPAIVSTTRLRYRIAIKSMPKRDPALSINSRTSFEMVSMRRQFHHFTDIVRSPAQAGGRAAIARLISTSRVRWVRIGRGSDEEKKIHASGTKTQIIGAQ